MVHSSAAPQKSPLGAQEQKSLAYAKKGLLFAVISGMIFSMNGIFISKGKGIAPFNVPELQLLVPFICAGVHDLCAAILVTSKNAVQGRLPELWRSVHSRPGRYVIGGACVGAFFGMGGYMVALQLAGPAYVLPLTSLYPAVAAVLAVFVLKERIRPLAWVGLACCIGGAIIIGYTPPSDAGGPLFYLGLFFAVLAAFGWGAEGVCATSGMDFIDPVVALNVYYLISSLLFWGLLIPVASMLILPEAGGMSIFMEFFTSRGVLYVAGAGSLGAISYTCWYKAMNMTGVSRAMALNISYALWGIVFSSFFTNIEITNNLIYGALAIFGGMVLVIGNPKDMLNLRNVE